MNIQIISVILTGDVFHHRCVPQPWQSGKLTTFGCQTGDKDKARPYTYCAMPVLYIIEAVWVAVGDQCLLLYPWCENCRWKVTLLTATMIMVCWQPWKLIIIPRGGGFTDSYNKSQWRCTVSQLYLVKNSTCWPYKTTNVMHWILFIRQILLLSSTCFEYQVLIFRRT